MTEPRRLSEEGSPAARKLLVAARSHRVPERTRRKLLRRAGWYVGIGAWASSAAALVKTLASAQGVVGVVLAGSVVVGTYVAVRTVAEPPTPTPPSPSAGEVASPGALANTGSEALPSVEGPVDVVEPTGQDDEQIREAGDGEQGARPGAPRLQPAREKAEDLRREVEALDDARALLASNPGGALQALQAYEARHPRGRLRLEARVLRVDALLRAGRMAEAKAEGEGFLRDHPNGFLAERVRRLLGVRSPSP